MRPSAANRSPANRPANGDAITCKQRLGPKAVETTIGGAFAKLGIREAPEDNRRVLAALGYLQR
jgi:hypothetical protein